MLETTMERMEKKSILNPDERRTFEKGQIDLVTVGDVTFGRATLQPGWKWSTCVRPLSQTELCEAHHLQYQLSGRLHVVMKDGSEFETVAGDVVTIPPGHDAWVVGQEPFVAIDISGMHHYGKKI